MTPQAAKPEVHAFTEEVATMLASGVFDTARLRQIEARISRLVKLGAGQDPTCDMILSMVAFGLGDREQAEKWARSAVSNPAAAGKVVLLNVGNVFANVGDADDLVEVLSVARSRYPNDKKASMFAYTLYNRAGLIFSAAQAFDRYADLIAPEHKMAAPQYQQHLKECQLATENGFTEADISARVSTAVGAVRNSGLEVLRQTRQPLDDGSFIQHFYVDADVSRCADLNFDIADTLCDNYEKTGAEFFSILCRPLTHYTLKNEVVRA
ncbi:MAG: hypothetical protein ACJ8LG_06430 [Massilia sp.]